MFHHFSFSISSILFSSPISITLSHVLPSLIVFSVHPPSMNDTLPFLLRGSMPPWFRGVAP